MRRITTLLTFSFIFLFAGQYAQAQLAGPGTRPHPGTVNATPTSIPGTIPGSSSQTTPVYIPRSPANVPTNTAPVYVPAQEHRHHHRDWDRDRDGQQATYQQPQAAYRAGEQAAEAQRAAAAYRAGEQAAAAQRAAAYQTGERAGHVRTEEARAAGNGHSDNGKHLGWYKNGKD